MSFVYPQFLFALFAVSIPIIIHLFNFRRFKKVYFSDIRFLKEVKQQTQNQNRIKHLLILISRIFAIAFLVFSFAQPFIPANNKNSIAGMQSVSVFVDNSFSMENMSKNGMLLDEAKKMAREIALAHSQTDMFQLLTNDFEGRHQRLGSREEFIRMLDEVKISPAVRTISEITARQTDVLSKSEAKNKKSFIVSDFQKSISDFQKAKEDSSVKTILLPVRANQQSNLYVDSCWFDSPVHQLNQAEKLNVRIKNLSDNKLENISVKLFLNNQQKTPSSFSIEPNESKDIQLSFTIKETGIQQGRIEITDYPVTYDDKFYFSFNVKKNIAVACISAASLPSSVGEGSGVRSIQSLFGKDSLFILNMQDENKIDYSSLASQQVIVLCELKNISSGLAQELNRFVQNGGSLIVFPSAETDTSSYKTFLSPLETNFYLKKDTSNTKTDWVNFESEIFSDVFEKPARPAGGKNENLDLPVVHSHYTQSHSNHTSEEILLKMRNGNPFFSKYTYKKGKLCLSAVPLNPKWSNLAKHAIFVPLMYKIAMNSQPSEELFYTVWKDNAIAVKAKLTGENVFKIKSDGSSQSTTGFEVIPENRVIDQQPTIFVHDQIKDAGNYDLLSGSERISGISFNYDRKESDLSRYSPDELSALYEKANLKNFSLINSDGKNITKILTDMNQGKTLWLWCIVLVLFFLAVETALLRLWK
ncbi:MAG: BatA domain-containing protein [Bacteroidetes bacterium]|nr:BatA domain-containing protein [Bacteroidota bacterium]